MEIRYYNTPEGSVACLMYALTHTDRFRRAVARRTWILVFVAAVAFLYALENLLARRSAGTDGVFAYGLAAGAFALLAWCAFGYRRFYAGRCRKRIEQNIAQAKDSLERERVLRVADGTLSIGDTTRQRAYPLREVERAYDYHGHLCIVLKNGTVAAVPDDAFADGEQRAALHDALKQPETVAAEQEQE